MNYLRAYINAVTDMALWVGAFYFLLHLLDEKEILTRFLTYVILIAGLGGPISYALNKRSQ